ncbi:unnamed protein product [Closterium sp. NIES-53]
MMAYANDITIIGRPASKTRAFNMIKEGLSGLGLRCNLTKSSAWSPSGSTGDLPKGLAAAVDGVKVLGSPIGTTAYCRRALREALEGIALPLRLVSKLHPQHAMLLLSNCISRKYSYLLRTTPADVLPLREWRGWSERLLRTALRAAHIHVPSKELEQSLVWRQAMLPIALGGVGLIDPLSEALAAYLASLKAAQTPLQQMPPSPNHQLWQVAALVSPQGDGVVGRGGAEQLSKHIDLHRAAELVGDTRMDKPGEDNGHVVRLISLQGVGAGNWLHAISTRADLTFSPRQFAIALGFRLGLALPVTDVCQCHKERSKIRTSACRTTCCGVGRGRTKQIRTTPWCTPRYAWPGIGEVAWEEAAGGHAEGVWLHGSRPRPQEVSNREKQPEARVSQQMEQITMQLDLTPTVWEEGEEAAAEGGDGEKVQEAPAGENNGVETSGSTSGAAGYKAGKQQHDYLTLHETTLV